MKWPGRIPVGAITVPVYEVKDHFPGDTDKGEFVYKNVPEPAIYIRHGMARNYTDLVRAHETAHAWLHITGLGNLLNLDTDQEEVFCEIVGEQLLLLLRAMLEENE